MKSPLQPSPRKQRSSPASGVNEELELEGGEKQRRDDDERRRLVQQRHGSLSFGTSDEEGGSDEEDALLDQSEVVSEEEDSDSGDDDVEAGAGGGRGGGRSPSKKKQAEVDEEKRKTLKRWASFSPATKSKQTKAKAAEVQRKLKNEEAVREAKTKLLLKRQKQKHRQHEKALKKRGGAAAAAPSTPKTGSSKQHRRSGGGGGGSFAPFESFLGGDELLDVGPEDLDMLDACHTRQGATHCRKLASFSLFVLLPLLYVGCVAVEVSTHGWARFHARMSMDVAESDGVVKAANLPTGDVAVALSSTLGQSTSTGSGVGRGRRLSPLNGFNGFNFNAEVTREEWGGASVPHLLLRGLKDKEAEGVKDEAAKEPVSGRKADGADPTADGKDKDEELELELEELDPQVAPVQGWLLFGSGFVSGLVSNMVPVQPGLLLAPLFVGLGVCSHFPSQEALSLVSAVHFVGNGVVGALSWSTRDVRFISCG